MNARFALATSGCLLALVATSGCGVRKEPTAATKVDSIRLTLDRNPSPSQLCFYSAQAANLFSEAGLNVTLAPPATPGTALQDLSSERSMLALASLPQLLIARGGGAPFVSVATVLRVPLWRLATHGKPDKVTINYPGMLVVARRSDLSSEGGVVRRFVQALARGCSQARSNPAPGLKALAAAPGAGSAKLAAAHLKPVLPQFAPPKSKPWGWQSPTSWQATLDWMTAKQLLGNSADPDAGYTNEFLAGQGL